MPRAASNAVQLPARIGRHQVLGYLADGGMAEIFLGKETDGRAVVIKRILPHLARQGSFVSMFIDEARIGSLVKHPNVVEVYELGQVGTDLFMVMEYLAGESVSGLLRRLAARDQRLALALAAYIVAEACAGLHAAHELCDESGTKLGLVHRDISPSNLFVTYEGSVKVLDFGIATAAHRLTKTATGQVKGKFSYMSPEQCLGEPLDLRSDIFSLGVVLYELTTMRRLFKRANELLVLHAVTEQPIPRPTRFIPGYPDVLERIALKALSRERDRRQASALELRHELLAAMTTLGFTEDPRAALAQRMEELFAERIEEKRALLRHIRANTDFGDLPAAEVDENVELPQLPESSAPQPRLTATRTDTVSPPSGSRAWIGILVLLLLLGGGGAAWWWWNQQQSATTSIAATEPAPAPAAPSAPVPSSPASTTPTPAVPAPEPMAPPPAPSPFVLDIDSVPSGATVTIDGKLVGKTPYQHTLGSTGSQRLSLRLEQAGYSSVTQKLEIDRDQRIIVPLAKVALPPEATKRGKRPKKKRDEPDPFGRFD